MQLLCTENFFLDFFSWKKLQGCEKVGGKWPTDMATFCHFLRQKGFLQLSSSGNTVIFYNLTIAFVGTKTRILPSKLYFYKEEALDL